MICWLKCNGTCCEIFLHGSFGHSSKYDQVPLFKRIVLLDGSLCSRKDVVLNCMISNGYLPIASIVKSGINTNATSTYGVMEFQIVGFFIKKILGLR